MEGQPPDLAGDRLGVERVGLEDAPQVRAGHVVDRGGDGLRASVAASARKRLGDVGLEDRVGVGCGGGGHSLSAPSSVFATRPPYWIASSSVMDSTTDSPCSVESSSRLSATSLSLAALSALI